MYILQKLVTKLIYILLNHNILDDDNIVIIKYYFPISIYNPIAISLYEYKLFFYD